VTLPIWLSKTLKNYVCFFGVEICPKFEDENLSEKALPKWSFVKSIPLGINLAQSPKM
jgi:hypothetical protein